MRPLALLPERRHVFHLFVVEAPDRDALAATWSEHEIGDARPLSDARPRPPALPPARRRPGAADGLRAAVRRTSSASRSTRSCATTRSSASRPPCAPSRERRRPDPPAARARGCAAGAGRRRRGAGHPPEVAADREVLGLRRLRGRRAGARERHRRARGLPPADDLQPDRRRARLRRRALPPDRLAFLLQPARRRCQDRLAGTPSRRSSRSSGPSSCPRSTCRRCSPSSASSAWTG